jgi:hypothetical protein
MKLYEISDKGELINLDELTFKENHVYLVDDKDKNTIFIWVGLEVPQYKKDITAAYARKIDKEREGSLKILIMKQKREYGSFLAMMDDLKRGLIPGQTSERRVELMLEEDTSVNQLDEKIEVKISLEQNSRIFGWLDQIKKYRGDIKQKEIIQSEKIEEQEEEIDFSDYVREGAYYLSLERYTYNELCWLLAEKILIVSSGMPSLEDIRQKAEQVFNSSSTYDELCWLNAEMDLLINEGYLEKKKKSLLF